MTPDPGLDVRLGTELWRIPDWCLDDVKREHTVATDTQRCRTCGYQAQTGRPHCRSYLLAEQVQRRRYSLWIGGCRPPHRP